MKKISPRLATTPSALSVSLGNSVAWRLAEIAPNSDGPRTRPAMTSPITRGWPILTATIPNRRATMSTIAMARKTAATSLLKSERCLVAVNLSPAGARPEGVLRTGLAVTAVEVLAPAAFAGVARSSGMTCTF